MKGTFTTKDCINRLHRDIYLVVLSRHVELSEENVVLYVSKSLQNNEA
jgi:hypothetical protein